MAWASSTANSQSASVVQAEWRRPPSSSDISPMMSPGRSCARCRHSPQGWVRLTDMSPASSTAMKSPRSSWRMTSHCGPTRTSEKKRTMRCTASASSSAMCRLSAHSVCSRAATPSAGRRRALISTARASQGTKGAPLGTSWLAKAELKNTESPSPGAELGERAALGHSGRSRWRRGVFMEEFRFLRVSNGEKSKKRLRARLSHKWVKRRGHARGRAAAQAGLRARWQHPFGAGRQSR